MHDLRLTGCDGLRSTIPVVQSANTRCTEIGYLARLVSHSPGPPQALWILSRPLVTPDVALRVSTINGACSVMKSQS